MAYLTAPCISHPENDYFAIVRNCYCKLLKDDFISAALLGLLEFWANGMLAIGGQSGPDIYLGKRSLKSINSGIFDAVSTTKLRSRLEDLAKRGFIKISQKPGGASAYYFCPTVVQRAIDLAFPSGKSSFTPAKVKAEICAPPPAEFTPPPVKFEGVIEDNPVKFEGVIEDNPVKFEGVSLYIKKDLLKTRMGDSEGKDLASFVLNRIPGKKPNDSENPLPVPSASLQSTGEDQISGGASFPTPQFMGKLPGRRSRSAPTLYPDQFEIWWQQWLAGFKLADRASKPDRSAAVKAWGQAIVWGKKEGYESDADVVSAILQGSELFWQSKLTERQSKGKMFGVPDPERFLRGSQHHPTPYWQVELDALEEEMEESVALAILDPLKGENGAIEKMATSDRRPERVDLSKLYPDGPWLGENGRLNEDFIRDRAKVWRTGDMPSAKSFAAMAVEDVMGIICGHYLKNPAKLELDWQAYAAKNQRYLSNVHDRIAAGVEILPAEQEDVLRKVPAMQGYQSAYEKVEPAIAPNTLRQRLLGGGKPPAEDELTRLNQWLKDDCLRTEAIRKVMASEEFELECDDSGSPIKVVIKSREVA